MSAVSGLLSSSNIGTSNDLVGEFQETIFVRNSKGMNVGSTLFGLMAKLKSEPADNIEYNWFERDPVKRVVYVNATVNSASGTVVVKGDSGLSTAGSVYIEKGHVLRNGTTGEYVLVTATPAVGNDTLTITRAFGGANAPVAASLTQGDELMIVSLGKDEGADPIRAVYEDPETRINYVQTFNSAVNLTNAFKGQVLRSDLDGPLTDRRIQALERIARDIEMAYFMGQRSRQTGTNGYQYYTGGIYDALLNNSNASVASNNIVTGNAVNTNAVANAVTLTNFNAWLSSFMVYGSDTKLAFCGPASYTALSTFANSAANGYRIMQNETVFGMHITTINTPYGELSLAFHPLLREIPQLNNWMFAVDLPLVVQKTFEPLFLEPDIQTPGNDSYKEQYRAKLGLKLKFANAFGIARSFSALVVN